MSERISAISRRASALAYFDQKLKDLESMQERLDQIEARLNANQPEDIEYILKRLDQIEERLSIKTDRSIAIERARSRQFIAQL